MILLHSLSHKFQLTKICLYDKLQVLISNFFFSMSIVFDKCSQYCIIKLHEAS